MKNQFAGNEKAVQTIWTDEDGIWVILKDGYIFEGGSTIHVENKKQLKEAMKEVEYDNTK